MTTNQFPARCYRCGKKVEAQTGLVSYPTIEQTDAWPKHPRGKVLVEHPACEIEHRGTFTHFIYQPA